MHYHLLILYYRLRNFLFPIYTGPSSVQYLGYSTYFKPGDPLHKGEFYKPYKVTIGKIYQSERQDRISYYIKDDEGHLHEVPKHRFADVSKIRNNKLKKIGIK